MRIDFKLSLPRLCDFFHNIKPLLIHVEEVFFFQVQLLFRYYLLTATKYKIK